MTDTAKSADEIEDVLASIRRLVAGPAGKPAAALAPQNLENSQKLVLTPALRVRDPDDPWMPVAGSMPDDHAQTGTMGANPAQDAEGYGDDLREDGDNAAWGLADRLADWGEIAESAQEAVNDAIAEGQAAEKVWAESERPPFRATLAHLHSATATGTFEAEAGDADWPDPSADQTLRELARVRVQSPQNDDKAVENTKGTASPPCDPIVASDALAPQDADPVAVGETGDAPIPDAPAAAQAAPDPRAEPGQAAAEVEGISFEDDTEVEDFGAQPTPFTFPDTEDGILDEETLREIISEVVRQELQSELGMRITRSVRKMVRREVRLALTLDELN
ncbi:hypothetical protein LSUCC0031_05535 [Rhodobacterales bacterium LSUCC0031]|nr:hypothetical protein [Rhodobacterales bacterium LSUCC0031]